MVSRYKVLYEEKDGVDFGIPTELDFAASNMFYDDTVASPTSSKSSVQDIADYLKAASGTATGQSVSSVVTTTTTSTSYAQMSLMTLTVPLSGTYQVIASCQLSAPGGKQVNVAIFVNGVQVAASERFAQAPGGSNDFNFSTNCLVTVTAGQAVALYWKAFTSFTATCTARSLNLIKTTG